MAQQVKSTMIFGCGNRIMGDDGFGPAVIDLLSSRYRLPDSVAAIDAGTAVREYLFDYLLSPEGRPRSIILLDAVDYQGRESGEVFLISPRMIPAKKVHDFSLHQFPSVNLLSEIEEYTGIDVTIIAAQMECLPEEVKEGLSPSMEAAVVHACETITQMLFCKYSISEVTPP